MLLRKSFPVCLAAVAGSLIAVASVRADGAPTITLPTSSMPDMAGGVTAVATQYGIYAAAVIGLILIISLIWKVVSMLRRK